MDENAITELTDGLSTLLGSHGAPPEIRLLLRPLASRAIKSLLGTEGVEAKLDKIRKILAAKDAVLAVFAD